MTKSAIFVSNKSQSKLYGVMCAVCAFLLVTCSLHCLVSSFNLYVNFSVVVFFTALFTGAFALLSTLVKSNRKFAVCVGVIFVVLAVIAMLLHNRLVSQFIYAVNSVLKEYSSYFYLPQSAQGAIVKKNATELFVAFSALLSFLLTFLPIRTGRLFFSIAIPIIVIIPCFILVDTLPDLPSLLTLITVLFTLFVSSAVCRQKTSQTVMVVPVVAFVMAVLVAVVYILNPVESFERKAWQDNLLQSAMDVLNENSNQEDLSVTDGTKNVQREIDLSKSGPLKQTHQKVMTIDSEYDGMIYLRGICYANYENNIWSTLTEEQLQSYPADFDSFTMTKSVMPECSINIETNRKEDVVYTPYFLSQTSTSIVSTSDALLKNSEGTKSYSVSFNPCVNSEGLVDDSRYNYSINEVSDAYTAFVYENYLSVPEPVHTEMMNLLYENNIELYAEDDIINTVRDFVSNSASYSRDTPQVPQGKDIAMWFLNESDTGYCVHFATAATLMLRTMGVPARYVSGYYVSFDRNDPNSTVVTTDNAHAWVEYYDDEIGWVPLETTSDDFSVAVYTPVVEDAQQQSPQQQTTGGLNAEPTLPTEPDNDTQNHQDPISDTQNKVATGIITAICALALAVAMLILRRKIVLAVREKSFKSDSNNKCALQFYRYLLRLSKHVYVHVPEKISDIANKARFSGQEITPEELDTVTQYVQQRAKTIESDISRFKKLYFEYILVII